MIIKVNGNYLMVITEIEVIVERMSGGLYFFQTRNEINVKFNSFFKETRIT